MRRTAWVLGILLGLAALVAAQTPDEAPRRMGSGMMVHGACPMPLKGAEVALAEIANGIAVTFTTKSGSLADLQRSVEWLANMQKAMADDFALREHLLPGDVTFELLPHGARLTFTAKDPTRTEEFRTQVRVRVDQMTRDNCAMMENMMRAMTRKDTSEAGTTGHHKAPHEAK